jgi:hypothetical protein
MNRGRQKVKLIRYRMFLLHPLTVGNSGHRGGGHCSSVRYSHTHTRLFVYLGSLNSTLDYEVLLA